jgi:hypothetical protein
MGEARYQDYLGVKSYVGEGVLINGASALKFDLDGKVTNYSELTYSPNTTKQYLQDWVSRYYNSDEGNLMSRSFGMLREVVIGYSLPKTMLGKTFQDISISLVGRNLFYFAEKKDVDLNQYLGSITRGNTTTTEGSSGTQTPSTRRYGINLSFKF